MYPKIDINYAGKGYSCKENLGGKDSTTASVFAWEVV